MKKKKLCFVIESFGVGGISRVVASLATTLADRQIAVTVLALPNKKTISAQWFDRRCKLRSFRGARLFSWIPLWWHLLFYRYDVVISGVVLVNLTTIIAHKLSLRRSKLITTTHTNLHWYQHKRSIKHGIGITLARYLYRFADHQIAVSYGAARSMEKVLHIQKEDIHTIYNPVAREQFFTFCPEAPHEWLKEEIPVIVGCGRLAVEKDFSLLIRSFATLIKNRDARLLILGDGKLRDNLQRDIEVLGVGDRALLVGEVDNPEAYMYHSRLFVLSSSFEGFGNVLVEALAVGCPVVSMDCPSGPTEILEGGKWGRLVDNADRTTEALASAIAEELDKERPSREYLQQRARDFTPEKITAEYLRLVYGE